MIARDSLNASVATTAGSPGETTGSSRDIVDDIWAFFASTKLALFLLLILAVASIGGTLVMQAPAELQQNPDGLRTWIERARPKYGAFTDLFQFIGFFWIFQSLWFRALLGLLAVNTAVCTVNRLPGIWHQVFGEPTRPRDELFERAQSGRSFSMNGGSSEAALDLLTRAMRTGGYRVVTMPGDGQTYLAADRFRFARFGTIVTHGALLLIMLASVASGPLGYFEDSAFAVPVGSTRAVGHGTGLAVRADDFADEYYPDGRPKDYRSELVLLDQGAEVRRQTVRVNEPLVHNGVRFHQAYYGPSALVAVADSAGGTIFRDAVALIWRSNDGQRPVGYFAVPGRDLHVYLVGSAGDTDTVVRPAEVLVEAYEGMVRTPTYRATLTQRQATSIAGLQFVFEREIPFTGLRVVHDPTESLIWVASTLMIIGVTINFALTPRHLWGRIQVVPGGVRVAVAGAGRSAAQDVSGVLRRASSLAAIQNAALSFENTAHPANPPGAASLPRPATVTPSPWPVSLTAAKRVRGRRAGRRPRPDRDAASGAATPDGPGISPADEPTIAGGGWHGR
ncbi:MAG: cytochrome c biogenesis protein ResB [Chloroflexota bacterium]